MPVGVKFQPKIVRSYKRLAYTPWHALSEFIDNSTESARVHADRLQEAHLEEPYHLRVSILYSPGSLCS